MRRRRLGHAVMFALAFGGLAADGPLTIVALAVVALIATLNIIGITAELHQHKLEQDL